MGNLKEQTPGRMTAADGEKKPALPPLESLQVPEASCSPIQLTPGTSEAPIPHHSQSSGDTPSQTFPSLLMKADLTMAKHRSFPPLGLCTRCSLCLQMPVWLAHPSSEWRLKFQFLREASPDEIKPSPLPPSYLPTHWSYSSPLSTPAAAGYPSLCHHPVHIQLSTKLQTPSGRRSSLYFHCCVLST